MRIILFASALAFNTNLAAQEVGIEVVEEDILLNIHPTAQHGMPIAHDSSPIVIRLTIERSSGAWLPLNVPMSTDSLNDVELFIHEYFELMSAIEDREATTPNGEFSSSIVTYNDPSKDDQLIITDGPGLSGNDAIYHLLLAGPVHEALVEHMLREEPSSP